MIIQKLILAALVVVLLAGDAAAQDSYLLSEVASEHDIEYTDLQRLSDRFQDFASDDEVQPCGHTLECSTGVACGDAVGCCDAVCCCDCSCYFSFFGGYEDLEYYRGEGNGGNSRQITFNLDGYLLGLTIGKRYCNNMRMECEVTYREDTADTYSIGNIIGGNFVPTATFPSNGSIHSVSTMGNLLYDFNHVHTKMKPYVGFGLGGVYVDGNISTPALGRVDSVNEYVFAYQLMAGVSRRICPWAEGYAEYRYFGTSGVSLGGGALVGNFDYESNNILFGVRLTMPSRR